MSGPMNYEVCDRSSCFSLTGMASRGWKGVRESQSQRITHISRPRWGACVLGGWVLQGQALHFPVPPRLGHTLSLGNGWGSTLSLERKMQVLTPTMLFRERGKEREGRTEGVGKG